MSASVEHSNRLNQRTILITGASHGLGRAVALACAAAGATVVACGRDVAKLESLAEQTLAAGYIEPILLPINLERAGVDDYNLIASRLEQTCGGLDALLLNAAELGELSPLTQYDGMTWARTFQVNLHSAFLLLQSCLPLLQRSRQGSVMFSLAAEGQQAKANWGAYAVSKYALRGLFDLTAAETANSNTLSVYGVLPPPSNTGLRRAAFPALNPQHLARPDVVAEHYVSLLTGETTLGHGEILTISPPT